MFRHVAKRAKDRGEAIARTAGKRGHRDRDNEAIAIGRARRRIARTDAGPIAHRRTNQIGEALQNIDAHRAILANAEPGRPVQIPLNILAGGQGGAAGSGEMKDIVEAFDGVAAAMFQGIKLRGEGARSALWLWRSW